MRPKLAFLLLGWFLTLTGNAAELPQIPYEKFVLRNGLTVVVHEDHKAPIVCIDVWYHVGSKNEKRGHTGLAHLFEHVMFSGSEHIPRPYATGLQEIGATQWNGATNEDRTHYYEDVPTSTLDYALWMESDRMGYLLGGLDQKKLDAQRGVVENEKRQRESQPYGAAAALITQNTYPEGHPYSWTVLGEMEDLEGASMSDVQKWFKTYYGPSNAVIVLAGDIDVKTARAKMEKYFGDIPAGPPIAHQAAWIAKMSGVHRQVVEDRVPEAKIFKVWNIPGFGTTDGNFLEMVAACLSYGKSSRLYKRLISQDQMVTDVSAAANLNEIGGQFVIEATVRAGQDIEKVEKALDQELARFLKDGPTEAELQRLKTQYRAAFLRAIEEIGGPRGKAERLAENEVFAGRPGAYRMRMERIAAAESIDLQSAARRWLSDGVYILEVRPFVAAQTVASKTDHSIAPALNSPPELKLPKLDRVTLRNGLKVIVAERHDLPIVDMWMRFDAGYAADQSAAPGTASMVAGLLDEGTKTRSSLQIVDELAMLGAELQAYASLDSSVVRLSALKSKLDPSLELFADVVLHPSFPDLNVKQRQQHQLSVIKNEQNTPYQLALRLVPQLLYGKGHAYGNPLTGSGSSTSITGITRDDLIRFHNTWFKPNNGTLVVVGDTTVHEIVPKIERLFLGWQPASIPQKNIDVVNPPAEAKVYLIDKPGASQSIIIAAQIAPAPLSSSEAAINAMNDGLGGTFTSRLNMDLRESKHWSYGVRTRLVEARGQRPFFAVAAVQADKTRESMTEIQKEFQDIAGSRPLTTDELEKIKSAETLSLPGSRETLGQVGTSILDLVHLNFPDDYYESIVGKIAALKPSDIDSAAKAVLRPNQLVWIVIGDQRKIESEVEKLQWGTVSLLDIEGNGLAPIPVNIAAKP